jgi:hypothetical protein
MKHINGRGVKQKGREFENEIVAKLLAAFPSLSPHDLTARSMGDPGIDIILSAAAREVLPFAFELKRVEKLNMNRALEQAEANAAKEGLHACLISRQSRKPAYATVRLDVLIRLLGGKP